MPKILAISGMVVAALILLLFGLDAASVDLRSAEPDDGYPVFDQRRSVRIHELVDLPRSRVIGRGRGAARRRIARSALDRFCTPSGPGIDHDLRDRLAQSQRSGERRPVRELLAEQARLSRAEPGCVRFEVYQSQPDATRFLLCEHWESAAALDVHRNGPRLSDGLFSARCCRWSIASPIRPIWSADGVVSSRLPEPAGRRAPLHFPSRGGKLP